MQHGRNNGKKMMAVRIIKHSFEIIHLLTDQNPIQVLVDAIINRYCHLSGARLRVCCDWAHLSGWIAPSGFKLMELLCWPYMQVCDMHSAAPPDCHALSVYVPCDGYRVLARWSQGRALSAQGCNDWEVHSRAS